MPSKAEQVAQLITSTLQANLVAIGAQAVYRDRQDAMERTETPVILVELVDEDSRAFGGNAPGRKATTDEDLLRLQVCVCVRSASWQTIADAVRVQAHQVLIASTALQAVLGESLRRDRADWRAADSDVPFGYCNQIYQCKYITSNESLDL